MTNKKYKPCEKCIYYSGYFASTKGVDNECMYDRLQGLGGEKNDFGSYFTEEYVDCKDRNKYSNCWRYSELTLVDKIDKRVRYSIEEVRKKFSLSYWLFGDL